MQLHLGQADAALSLFQIAADKGYSIQMLGADPQLAALRDDPGFDHITRKDY
jgi:hypothetical protein